MTREQVTDLIITALEGGSNYWYFLDDLSMLPPKKDNSLCLSERIVNAAYDGIDVPVMDCEDTTEVLGHISKKNITRGIKLMKKDHPIHYGDVFTENWDATTGDVFFQLVVMGEVVFG